MKKPLSLKDKFRIFMYLLKLHEEIGLITTCGLCGSSKIKLENSKERLLCEDKINYEGYYECQNCYARCENTEVWKEYKLRVCK